MNKVMQFYKLLKQQHGDNAGWWPTTVDNWRLEVMIGCILTQNTNWKNVEKALEQLYKHNLIEEKALLEIDEEELKQLIRSSGYYNQKARRLKRLASYLEDNPLAGLLQRDWREVREELLAIKGIGPETADSILLYALEKPVFVIDAYTQRLVKRWGLFDKSPSYHELQGFFMDSLPESVALFKEYHGLIVEHCKLVCKKKPLCKECVLSGICEKNI